MAFTFPSDTNSKVGAVRENETGEGFHVPVVMYKSDGVTPNEGSIGTKTIYQSIREPELAAGASVVVFENQKPSVIERLEWATSSRLGGQIRLMYLANGEYVPMAVIRADGSGQSGFTPATINLHGSDLFSIYKFDDEKNEYKFALNKELSFPEGFKIELSNTNSTDLISIGCVLFGKEV